MDDVLKAKAIVIATIYTIALVVTVLTHQLAIAALLVQSLPLVMAAVSLSGKGK